MEAQLHPECVDWCSPFVPSVSLSIIPKLQHLPPSTTGSTNAADLAIARQFFDSVSQSGAGTLQGSALAAPREGFESLYRDPRPTALHTADIGPSFWNRPVNMPISSALANAKWSDEFSYVPAAGSAETATTHQVGDFHPMLPRSFLSAYHVS